MSEFNITLSIGSLILALGWSAFIMITDREHWYEALHGLPLILVCSSALVADRPGLRFVG